jgi:hypothetical protein
LLSPNKGIETAIRALPEIVSECPASVYVVAGITHPNVKQKDGESYRQSLKHLAEQLGVASRVIFWDRYLQQEELSALVAAADIYLSPYVNVEQTASGTLAYALGAGKVIVSTPFWYAQEMLRDGVGVLVPFADSDALAERVVELIKNRDQRIQLSRKAYDLGRSMVWGKVAQTYAKTFETALRTAGAAKSTCSPATRSHKDTEQLPPLKLNHLLRLSDSTGIIQHAVFTIPNRAEGYSTDDNARALIVAIWLEKEKRVLARRLASKYLAFLWHAFNSETGRMRNFLSYDRRWLESIGSEECHARSLWALGFLINHSGDPGLSGVASQLFLRALPSAWDFASLRAIAFTLLGISDWSASRSSWSELSKNGALLAERLLESYLSNSSSDWPWFEDRLTYFNARLPHALLRIGHLTDRQEMVEVALRSLQWLVSLQISKAGQFSPIGNKGFYPRGSERARFDQQPIEAQSMISACLEAYRVTGEKSWYDEAYRAFLWFLGSNDLGLSLYDRVTGGCRDGLHEDSVNQNQGAESTLAFILSLLEMLECSERDTQDQY